MSKETKDIPAEEIKLMQENARIAASKKGIIMTREDFYMAGAKAEYLRHLSGKAVIEIEIRRSTIDRLYQSILASGQPFPGELREVFHKAMSSLGSSGPTAHPEWVDVEDELPPSEVDREYSLRYGVQGGWEPMTGFFDADAKQFYAIDHGTNFTYFSVKEYPGLQWLKESISSEPAKESQAADNGISLITKERREQIEKHGRTLESDRQINADGQLCWAAALLTRTDDEYSPMDLIANIKLPDWNQNLLKKMDAKPYKDRLIIAGALIAAELDRLLCANQAQSSPPSVKPDKMRSLTDKEAEVLGKTLYRTAKKERSVEPEREDFRCPSCGELWDTKKHNSCSCGAIVRAIQNEIVLHGKVLGTDTHSSPTPPAVQQEAKRGDLVSYYKWIKTVIEDKNDERDDESLAYRLAREFQAHVDAVYEGGEDLQARVAPLQSQLYTSQQERAMLQQEILGIKAEAKEYREWFEKWFAMNDTYDEGDSNGGGFNRMVTIARKLFHKYTPQTPTKQWRK